MRILLIDSDSTSILLTSSCVLLIVIVIRIGQPVSVSGGSSEQRGPRGARRQRHTYTLEPT